MSFRITDKITVDACSVMALGRRFATAIFPFSFQRYRNKVRSCWRGMLTDASLFNKFFFLSVNKEPDTKLGSI